MRTCCKHLEKVMCILDLSHQMMEPMICHIIHYVGIWEIWGIIRRGNSLCWYLGNLGNNQERQLERQWCEYAMRVAEGEYLKELVKLGYGEGQSAPDAKVFREEITLYVTKLRNEVNRNNMGHVFSRSVKQVWMKTDTYAKTQNRCLLDQPTLALEDGYKKKLIAILEDLAIDMPNRFHALGNIIPMQAYFLKTILQKPVCDEVIPDPGKLPRKRPPPIK